MGLYKDNPPKSSRMGMLFILLQVKGLAILEYGSMGHTLYQYKDAYLRGIDIQANCYSTHLSEYDIALGDTQRLHDAINQLLTKEEVEAVILLPSSIGEMVGIDLQAEIEQGDYQGVFTLEKGGFEYSYEEGLEEAYTLIKDHFPHQVNAVHLS